MNACRCQALSRLSDQSGPLSRLMDDTEHTSVTDISPVQDLQILRTSVGTQGLFVRALAGRLGQQLLTILPFTVLYLFHIVYSALVLINLQGCLWLFTAKVLEDPHTSWLAYVGLLPFCPSPLFCICPNKRSPLTPPPPPPPFPPLPPAPRGLSLPSSTQLFASPCDTSTPVHTCVHVLALCAHQGGPCSMQDVRP